MIATASVAPAYSLAATIGLLVAAVSLQAPAAILASFFPVFFIALAYYFMNKQDPNCGAFYTWISRTLNPHLGWFTGWAQMAANVLFCVAAPLLAGSNTLALLNNMGVISSDAAGDAKLVAIVGFVWLGVLADLISGADSPLTRLPLVNHRSPSWEPEPLRWLGVRTVQKGLARVDARAERTGRPPTGHSLAERLSRH